MRKWLPKEKVSATSREEVSNRALKRRAGAGGVGPKFDEECIQVDTTIPSTKKTKRGEDGASIFKSKFYKPGKTPTQVFQDKYHPILKQHGWGGGGKKLPKNWDEREKAYNDLTHTMGQKVMAGSVRAAVVSTVAPSQVASVLEEDCNQVLARSQHSAMRRSQHVHCRLKISYSFTQNDRFYMSTKTR